MGDKTKNMCELSVSKGEVRISGHKVRINLSWVGEK